MPEEKSLTTVFTEWHTTFKAVLYSTTTADA